MRSMMCLIVISEGVDSWLGTLQVAVQQSTAGIVDFQQEVVVSWFGVLQGLLLPLCSKAQHDV